MSFRLRETLAVLSLAASMMIGCEVQDPLGNEAAFAVPADFNDVAVTTVTSPTALAFLPDGTMLITSQLGPVRVFENGALKPAPAIDLSAKICKNSERGVLGIAVDPQFNQNKFVYLFYTFKRVDCSTGGGENIAVNRVSRFVYDTGSDKLGGEVVLVDNIPSIGANHNAGDLEFGADGYLYITSGDGGCQSGGGNCAGLNTNARYKSHLLGKVLRIDRNGNVPADNPWVGLPGAAPCAKKAFSQPALDDLSPCTETWAWGLRNPFRFARKPGTSQFFINDVGQAKWEEIDEGQKGANYGWNTREGFCQYNETNNCTPNPAGLTNPVFAYGRETGCFSITGGAFVPGEAFGPDYKDAYLFADYGCGKIFRLVGNTMVPFATGPSTASAVHLRFGPGPNGPALYYTTYAGSDNVRRIDYAPVNPPPTAVIAATPTSGPAPLVVSFSGSGSFDPNGTIVEYKWTFGDGQSTTTSSPTTSHTYAQSGTFVAELVVKDNGGQSSPKVTVTVQPGNTPPNAQIVSPVAGETFHVGEKLVLTASGSDAQDGTLPTSSFSWDVLLHHNDSHTHPWLTNGVGNNLEIVAPTPEDLEATDGSYLSVHLTAKDSKGLTTTVVRNVLPVKVPLTFVTQPPGLQVVLNGFPKTTPITVTSWAAWGLDVSAPTQVKDGKTWKLASWSDGGAASHTIVTPGSPTTYTATFAEAPTFSAKINFQPAGAAVPAGYLADTGAVFGDRGNGLSYGWNADNAGQTRDRNQHADQRYDTLTHLQKPENPDARWEIAVPNGSYQVKVVVGDPGYFDSVFRLTAEGVQILGANPTTGSRFAEATASVTVADGRLTLGNGAGAANNKICFVEIIAQ